MTARLAAVFALAWLAAAQPTPVILISIDTLRADRLSAYGYTRAQTPALDSFAEHGTLFAAADSQAPLTLPSHVSLFTSTYPFENRIQENAEPLPAGAVTLATVLKSHGYKTAAFIGAVFLEKRMGLDQGFDYYDSPFDFRVFSPMSGEMFFAGTSPNPMSVRDRRDGALVVRAATQWLGANHGTQPVFVFLHLFDMHLPYRSGYDAQLAYVDRLMATFKQALVRGGWWDRSIVVLLSDHGESLGDHGEASHGYFIYESTLHVPLLIHWPAGQPVSLPARVEQPAALIDVAPTILDALHFPAPPSFAGRSLMDRTARPIVAESMHAFDAFGWSPLRSIRIGEFKYIDAPKPELYNLAADPQEQKNLAAQDPRRAQSMKSELAQLLTSRQPQHPAPVGTPTARDREALRSLGYVGPGPKSAPTLADPKDRFPEFQQYEDSQIALYKGRLSEAAAILRKILAADPGNMLARRDLGGIYLEQKSYARARTELERVAAAAPDDYVTQYQLSLALDGLGLKPRAAAHKQIACKIAPDAAACK